MEKTTAGRGIRSRVIGVLLVPMVAVMVLGGLRIDAAVDQAGQAAHTESIAEALPATFGLALQLATEREVLSADAPEEVRKPVLGKTGSLVLAWDRVRRGIRFGEDARLRADVAATSRALVDIDRLRLRIADPATREEARQEYTDLVNLLFGIAHRLPPLGDAGIFRQAEALADIRGSSEAVGAMRRLIAGSLVTGSVADADRTALTQARATYLRNTRAFARLAAPRVVAEYDATNGSTTAEGGVGAPMIEVVTRVVESGRLPADLTPQAWAEITQRFVEGVGPVIISSARQLSDDVSALRAERQREAILTGVLVGLLMLLTLLLGWVAGRSVVAPLRRLREAAQDLADHDLPRQVRRLAQSDGTVTIHPKPLQVGSRRDEVAEVAAALSAVHAEALRLAAEQARMRAGVDAIFVNLARRSQTLVERQLRLIDELEAGEQDPDALAHLFRLDHLATRMRRNDESLLVLAGGEMSKAARDDVPMLDVLRAAASEIEQYGRVIVDSPETGLVGGKKAVDLVHLLAELVENATSFSSPDTPVTVHTERVAGDGTLLVQVTDLGVGLTEDQLAEANRRLGDDSPLDADTARRMGLLVVARLAARHQWTVTLRSNSPRGIAAQVLLPADIVAGAGPALVAPAPEEALVETPVPAPATPVPAPAAVLRADSSAVPADPLTGSLEPASPGVSEDDVASTPIFATLTSTWFTPLANAPAPRIDKGRIPDPLTDPEWRSPGDEGWQRAAEVERRLVAAAPMVTSSGLPKRVPGTHLLPGAAEEAAPAAAVRSVAPPRRSDRLASFQQGVRRARATGGEVASAWAEETVERSTT